MTLMEQAQKNIVTKEVEEVAKYEQVSTDFVLKGISEGTIVIPKNIKRIHELYLAFFDNTINFIFKP